MENVLEHYLLVTLQHIRGNRTTIARVISERKIKIGVFPDVNNAEGFNGNEIVYVR